MKIKNKGIRMIDIITNIEDRNIIKKIYDIYRECEELYIFYVPDWDTSKFIPSKNVAPKDLIIKNQILLIIKSQKILDSPFFHRGGNIYWKVLLIERSNIFDIPIKKSPEKYLSSLNSIQVVSTVYLLEKRVLYSVWNLNMRKLYSLFLYFNRFEGFYYVPQDEDDDFFTISIDPINIYFGKLYETNCWEVFKFLGDENLYIKYSFTFTVNNDDDTYIPWHWCCNGYKRHKSIKVPLDEYKETSTGEDLIYSERLINRFILYLSKEVKINGVKDMHEDVLNTSLESKIVEDHCNECSNYKVYFEFYISVSSTSENDILSIDNIHTTFKECITKSLQMIKRRSFYTCFRDRSVSI